MYEWKSSPVRSFALLCFSRANLRSLSAMSSALCVCVNNVVIAATSAAAVVVLVFRSIQVGSNWWVRDGAAVYSHTPLL